MKVILTGATGFIGLEVLTQLLVHPTISSVVVLSRRALPSSIPQSPKLKTIIMDDFNEYPPPIMAELSGADACIWTLGVKNVDTAVHKQVTINYTTAAATAFEGLGSAAKPFRLIFMSGILAVRDQESSVWFMGEQRKLKGEAENILLKMDRMDQGLQTYIMRPAGVLARSNGNWVRNKIQGLLNIKVDNLAAAAVELAVHGGEKRIWENGDLVKMSRALLEKQE